MKATLYHEAGGPEVLQYTDVPDPRPDFVDVVIDVAATALNRLDIVQRAGRYQLPGFSYPHIAGMDPGRRTDLSAGPYAAIWHKLGSPGETWPGQRLGGGARSTDPDGSARPTGDRPVESAAKWHGVATPARPSTRIGLVLCGGSWC